ncbi:response regulator [Paenibacillus hamazuiensis]|uniref:response regulator n=1 Tax=Paenibacillus hamazuiensis TaxID=2936508 RepID=UPI00200E8E4D|nr:response regulator [Paenibacillus hamazuiensis]
MLQLLLVDDEINIVESMATKIQWSELGIESVFRAYSGEEALEILKTTTIDIVITDIRMPGIDGLALMELIKNRWKKTKVILLSGYAEFEFAKKAITNHAYDYLLKPISDEHIYMKVKEVVGVLLKEQANDLSYQKALQTMREHLPKHRAELLNELLQGKKLSYAHLFEKLTMLQIPLTDAEPFALMIVRLEDEFVEKDYYSLSLLEYAVGNMAEEIFNDTFRLWHCKDVHDYLVYVVSLKQENNSKLPEYANAYFEERAVQLQLDIKRYLKGKVSILISEWGGFPEDLTKLYHSALSAFRKRVGNQREIFTLANGIMEVERAPYLQSLYEAPLLVHLMEAANWKESSDRLISIFDELKQKWGESKEFLIEVFFSIYSTLSYIAHKNGKELKEIVSTDLYDVVGLVPCRSVASLQNWAFQALEQIRNYMTQETVSTRQYEVGQIKEFVQNNLTSDVSLQAIAEYTHMHPVNISKLFKSETGENLSDYIFKLKMEKACYLLKNSRLKNYEIALQLGYQNPNYFIKVFKKYFGMTPQEFR